MWAIRGRIVAMTQDTTVAPSESAVFTGRVWIGDDGRIVAVTEGRSAGPPGSAGATVVDVGTSLVVPGLVDLHNHLAYNTLPLWTEPKQQTPFLHHNSWTKADSYSKATTWPAYALITACPQELLAYVEAKAIVGGTTSIQGSPPKNKPRNGWLVRNIDDESFDSRNPNLIYASVLTMKTAALADRANKMRNGSVFIYHCSEGRRGSIVAREFTDAEQAGCLRPEFVAVHTNAVDPEWYQDWRTPGAIAWSPFSNLWLYGQTADVPAARAAGVSVCLGSDWAPSGTKQIQGELKSARLTADALGWTLTDFDIVAMATSLPGDVLARAWGRQVGRLQPRAQADLVVIDAKRGADPFSTIVSSTEDDIDLVVIDGIPRYGTSESTAKALQAAAHDTSGDDDGAGRGPVDEDVDHPAEQSARDLGVGRDRRPDGRGAYSSPAGGRGRAIHVREMGREAGPTERAAAAGARHADRAGADRRAAQGSGRLGRAAPAVADPRRRVARVGEGPRLPRRHPRRPRPLLRLRPT